MTRRVLDLFCGAGGASYGYYLAGFDVVGVDLVKQPHHPFEFVQADALEFPLGGFDLIHASPPCQAYSATSVLHRNDHPRLIGPVRARLQASGALYVIENVKRAPLLSPVELCGAMFGLTTYDHRLFEASFRIPVPFHPGHVHPVAKMGRPPEPGEYIQAAGHFSDVRRAREAYEIPWMTRDELAQAIPPAFTRHIGAAAIAGVPAPIQEALW